MQALILGSGGFVGQNLKVNWRGKYSLITCGATVESYAHHRTVDWKRPNYREIMRHYRPEICVNCSGSGSVPVSLDLPHVDFEANVSLVADLLEAIRVESPETRFIHLSSAAVYGDPTTNPISELSACNPISPYGFHKQMAEMLCAEYAAIFNIRTVSLRIFSAYGPGLRKQLFWDIYSKWKATKTVSLDGTGSEVRDFIFISDLRKAIEAVIEHHDFQGQAINIASGRSCTIKEAANTLLSFLGAERSASFNGRVRSGDPLYWATDISRLQLLGFSCEYDLAAGLTETAKWLKELA